MNVGGVIRVSRCDKLQMNKTALIHLFLVIPACRTLCGGMYPRIYYTMVFFPLLDCSLALYNYYDLTIMYHHLV